MFEMFENLEETRYFRGVYQEIYKLELYRVGFKLYRLDEFSKVYFGIYWASDCVNISENFITSAPRGFMDIYGADDEVWFYSGKNGWGTIQLSINSNSFQIMTVGPRSASSRSLTTNFSILIDCELTKVGDSYIPRRS